MQNTPHSSANQADQAIPLDALPALVDGWLISGDISQHSQRTIGARRDLMTHLLWFLRAKDYVQLDIHTIRAFLYYCSNGHKDAGGRWGNPTNTRPVRPRTIETYHGHIRSFFSWCVREGAAVASPMDRIPVPIARDDQIVPLTAEEAARLVAASRRTRYGKRDEAIILFLLDTGVRASELCTMKRGDVDMSQRRATVLGKGNKRRIVPFQATTARALWSYMQLNTGEDPGAPLFRGCRGELTRSGLQQLLDRLEVTSGVADLHPHRLRHTCAVMFLRAGGNPFALMNLLGHTDLTMTRRYIALAESDVMEMHRRSSPVEYLLKKKP